MHAFSDGSVHSFPQSAVPSLAPQNQPFAPVAPSAPTLHHFPMLGAGYTHCPHLSGCSARSFTCRPDTGFRSTAGGSFLGHRASKIRHRHCTPACPGFRHLTPAWQRSRSTPFPLMPSPSPRLAPPCQDAEETCSHQLESHWVGPQSLPQPSPTQTPEQPAGGAVSSSPLLSPPSTNPVVPEEPARDGAPSPQQSPPLDVPPWDNKISILFIPEPSYSISSLGGEHGPTPSYYKAHLPWMSLPARTRNILADWVDVQGPANDDTGLVPVLIHEYVSLASPFPIMTDTQ